MILLSILVIFNNFLLLLLRFQVQTGQIIGKSLCSSSAGEGQATKRQKLEGGHSRKVGLHHLYVLRLLKAFIMIDLRSTMNI